MKDKKKKRTVAVEQTRIFPTAKISCFRVDFEFFTFCVYLVDGVSLKMMLRKHKQKPKALLPQINP